MVGKALCAMVEYFGTDRQWIVRSLKVYGYVRAIALREDLRPDQMIALECAAALHYVGVRESLRLFATSGAQYREVMGVKIARELLLDLQFPRDLIDEILFLIGHHGSFDTDGGLPLQILFEASALVSLEEGRRSESPEKLRVELFRTRTGRELLSAAFGIEPPPLVRVDGPVGGLLESS